MVRTVSFNIVRSSKEAWPCRLAALKQCHAVGMLFAARTVERRDIRSARIPVAVARGDPPPAKRDCATQCSTHHCRGSPGGESPLDWPNDTDCAAQCDGAGAAQAVRPKGKAEAEAETGKRKAYEPLCGGESAGQCCVGPPSGASGAVHAFGSARRFPLSRALGATVAHRPGRCRAHAAARTVSGMR